jgi:cytochrome c oxidase subunit 2
MAGSNSPVMPAKSTTVVAVKPSAAAAPVAAVAAPASIDVAASNWKFAPDTITLHAGQTTQLHLTSTQGVHGIKSDDLGIPLTTLIPGKVITVSVTPKKAGTYVLHCAIMCGAGHDKMSLTITVI